MKRPPAPKTPGNIIEITYSIEQTIKDFWADKLTVEEYEKMKWEKEFSAIWARKESQAFLAMVKDSNMHEVEERTQRILEDAWRTKRKEEWQARLEARIDEGRVIARSNRYQEDYLFASPVEIYCCVGDALCALYPLGPDEMVDWNAVCEPLNTWERVVSDSTIRTLNDWAKRMGFETSLTWKELFLMTVSNYYRNGSRSAFQ